MQFKRVLLVDQVEGPPVGEFARLAAAELLAVQESGIRSQLWRKVAHVDIGL